MDHLVENEDYYYNSQGYIVLTESFHLKKGYCCGNGCRHCPYNYDGVPEPMRSELSKSTDTGAPHSDSCHERR
ncbi:MAG: hypothetical protein H7X88_09250 [Gloeobacteraceae cyanobacterium ES-bin-316]|nr:hypothetical protein [Ferruginibacter sp.]